MGTHTKGIAERSGAAKAGPAQQSWEKADRSQGRETVQTAESKQEMDMDAKKERTSELVIMVRFSILYFDERMPKSMGTDY